MIHQWMPPNPMGDETDHSDALALLADLHPAWHRQAACHGLTSLMFTERGESTEDAKAVCAGCPVRVLCLEWSLTQGPTLSGIWGGLSQKERRREKRRRRIQAA